ncbi:AAA family ATPase [Lactovum odontotermitis]
MLKLEKIIFPHMKSISLHLYEPGLYGIVGKNGIGKSTLFGVINGEVKVKEGVAEVGSVSYLPSTDIFDLNLTAGNYFSLLNAEETRKANVLLKKFQAESLLKLKLSKYSLGMLQLFAIIFMLSIDSDIVIMDEMSSGLDVAHKKVLFDLLNVEKQQRIVLYTSHNLEEVEKFCDKSYYLTEKGLQEILDFAAVKQELTEEGWE